MPSTVNSLADSLVRSRSAFETCFSKTVDKLGLSKALNSSELAALYRAAFYAAACNISLNGLGCLGGEITPEMEPSRMSLEWVFMSARDEFCASASWKRLPAAKKVAVQKTFLSVQVLEENLAA